MQTNLRVAELLTKLSSRRSSSTVFNPYENEYAKKNLKLYLEYFLNKDFRYIMIGEAPGYDGCRWTGIPFTSGYVIRNSKHKIFSAVLNDYYVEKVVKESTATVMWEYLDTKDELPFLWNSFPFHPHLDNNCNSNRVPTKDEIQEGAAYVRIILEIFTSKIICPLGRIGERTLKRNFPDTQFNYIRHPARGGKPKFIEGMEMLYSQ